MFDEGIYAAYIDYYNRHNTIDYGVGMRTEYSISQGDNMTIDSGFTRYIFQVFPSGYIRKMFGAHHSLMLTYNKRIDRPDYNSLNPFVFYIDNFSFWRGNTTLRPQLVHNLDLAYSFQQRYFLNFYYNYTRDAFLQLPIQEDAERTVFNTVQNVGFGHNTGATLSCYISPLSWWYSATSFNLNYNVVLDRRSIVAPGSEVGGFQGNFYTYHAFSLPKSLRVDATFSYNLPSRSFWNIAGYAALHLGMSKTFKKSTVTISLNDIFNRIRYNATIDYQNLDIRSLYKPETRMVRLTYSYQFGSNLIKQQRERQTAAEEEAKRVKN